METKEINKLDESVKWSLRKLEKFRETTTKAVKQYVGSHYGEGGANRKVPVNLLELATTIYVRLLAARAPKCVVGTHFPPTGYPSSPAGGVSTLR